MRPYANRRVLLGVSGGIASYKAASFGSPFFPDATRFDGDNGLHEWLQLGVRGRFSL